MPAHLFRLQAIDVVLRRHRRLRFVVRFVMIQWIGRQQRRGLGLRHSLCGKPRACGEAESQFQKMTAFHRNLSLIS